MYDCVFLFPTAIVMFIVAVSQQATVKPPNLSLLMKRVLNFMRTPGLAHILVTSSFQCVCFNKSLCFNFQFYLQLVLSSPPLFDHNNTLKSQNLVRSADEINNLFSLKKRKTRTVYRKQTVYPEQKPHEISNNVFINVTNRVFLLFPCTANNQNLME